MANKDLIKFIKEARKRGFQDYQIKEPLLKHGWNIKEIEEAFSEIDGKNKTYNSRIKYRKISENQSKNRLFIPVDSEVLKIIEKRAKKNFFTVEEQIEDILRRSCIRSKSIKKEEEKLDDLLVSLFSRRRR